MGRETQCNWGHALRTDEGDDNRKTRKVLLISGNIHAREKDPAVPSCFCPKLERPPGTFSQPQTHNSGEPAIIGEEAEEKGVTGAGGGGGVEGTRGEKVAGGSASRKLLRGKEDRRSAAGNKQRVLFHFGRP